jgi:hypothetical protein
MEYNKNINILAPILQKFENTEFLMSAATQDSLCG